MTDAIKAAGLHLVGLALVAAAIVYSANRPHYSYVLLTRGQILRVNDLTGEVIRCRPFVEEFEFPVEAVECQTGGRPMESGRMR